MRSNFSVKRILMLCLLLVFLVPILAACRTKNDPGNQSAEPTEPEQPTGPEQPAEVTPRNERPDLISEDNAYADVPVYDKFGIWPAKTGDKYYSSEVGTWFTVWWTEKGESTYDHWFQNNWTRLKPVDYGYYSSGNRDYLISVFVRLRYIGIDFLVLDDTNGHWNDYGMIARNMYKCFRVANELNGYTPKMAIATGGPLRDGNNAQQQKEFDEYYSVYYGRFPEVFYQYEGKPLLLMYVAGEANRRYADDRYTQRYGTGFISWQSLASDQAIFKTQGNWGWVFNMQNEGSEIMGVQPGYNKAHQGENIQYFPREGGKRYIEMWLAAIKADPRVIMIPSYNDHAEETGWEATIPIRSAPEGAAQDTPDEDPYVYEKITEAYLALRYGYIEGFFYQPENEAQVYRCVNGSLQKTDASEAGKEPIILIPEGYMEWEQGRNKG